MSHQLGQGGRESSSHHGGQGGRGNSSHHGSREGKGSSSHHNGRIGSSAVIEMTTQDQLNEVACIKANLRNHISDLIGKLGRDLEEENDK